MALRQLSPYNAWTDRIFLGPRDHVFLGSSVPAKDEVFASLTYLSEVKKVGKSLLLKLGHAQAQVDIVFHRFRSFIRQAHTFYESAVTLHPRASALIYYYSFLNLAKAYVCLRAPSVVVSGRVGHGLFYRFEQAKLSAQFVGVEAKGVFPTFYQQLTGAPLPRNLRLNVCQLLTYCSDIAYECQTAGIGLHRGLPVRCRVLIDRNSRVGFVVLSISLFDRIEHYKKALAPFLKYYEEVDALQPAQIYRNAQVFGLTQPEARGLRYFEGKKYPLAANDDLPVQVLPDAYEALRGLYLSNQFKDDNDFFLQVPWNKTRQITFNEILAIYAMMFYLGSLVRYNPAYLESIIESTDSWIIERFVRCCTVTFLRHIGSLIAGTDNVYFPR